VSEIRVQVIAYTKMGDVPEELMGDGTGYTQGQDRGSHLARLIECAGRTCYDSYGRGRNSAAYHQHILEVGHGSVLEHASISFYISGISRGCSHELVRHRAGTAISQRSTRYVDESESDWCWHPLLGELDMTGKNLVKRAAQDGYRQMVTNLESILTFRGTDRQTARKQARGAARGILGNALETALVWTANVRALRNVIEQRASEHADAEIRLLANALLDAAVVVCPEYFSDYEKVPCPDGIGYGVTTRFRKV
jgi:thymidylate synthase (FAD)